jgi:hypothetical protein
MFTVLVQRKDGRERLLYIDSDIEWEPKSDGGLLIAGGTEYHIASGDRVFVMNSDGQTVQRYGRR